MADEAKDPAIPPGGDIAISDFNMDVVNLVNLHGATLRQRAQSKKGAPEDALLN